VNLSGKRTGQLGTSGELICHSARYRAPKGQAGSSGETLRSETGANEIWELAFPLQLDLFFD
jgi:hypothetical protein